MGGPGGRSGPRRGACSPPRRLAATAFAVVALASCAQDATPGDATRTATIGVLRAVRSPEPQNLEVFLSVLEAEGFVAGRNLRLLGADPAEVHADPTEAEAVVRSWAAGGLDLVLALSSSGAIAAARGAPNTTVLFLSNDPMAVGLVNNERHPEGRLTGATFRVPADRTLDLARRALPDLRRIGFLYPPADPAAVPARDAAVAAAASLGLEVVLAPFQGVGDVADAIARLRDQDAGCVVLANAPSTVRSFPAITAALAGSGMPAIANTTADFALLVLEPDTGELYRQMGRQAVRLLSGTPVFEVPVEDPARFRFVFNARVASQLGLSVPDDVVRTADTVIRP